MSFLTLLMLTLAPSAFFLFFSLAVCRCDTLRNAPRHTTSRHIGPSAQVICFMEHKRRSMCGDRINVSAPPVSPASSPRAIVDVLQAGAAAKSPRPGKLSAGLEVR